jgi:5-methylcytosine-specific restriction endonuclease McrA
MSQRIRLGNVYQHDDYGEVLTVHKDHQNNVWFREVIGRDNAGVISTDNEVKQSPYKQFLSSVSMRDYPHDWNRKAKAIRQRDNEQCQSCGTKDEELHVHHIVPLGAGGSNAKSNLITLCEQCHGKVHSGVS